MKNQIRVALLIALAMVFWSSGSHTSRAAKVLRWQLEPDQQYRLVLNWTSENVIADSKVANSTQCDLIWTVKAVNADGGYEIAQTLASVKQSLQTTDGTVFQYDSTLAGETTGTTAFLASYWKPLLGVERAFTMTPQGQVIESEESKPPLPADNALISRNFGRDAWRNALSQGSVVFPDEALEPMQAWTEPQAVALPSDASKLTVTRSFTYEGEIKKDDAESPLDLIKVENRFEIEADNEQPSTIKIIQQSGSGEIHFDAGVGRLVNSKLDQSLKLRYEANESELESQLTTTFNMSFQLLPKVETTAVDTPPNSSP